MKNIEFSSKNGVFDMNSFICECDAAVSGNPLPEEEQQAPAPAPVAVELPTSEVPVCLREENLQEDVEEDQWGLDSGLARATLAF